MLNALFLALRCPRVPGSLPSASVAPGWPADAAATVVTTRSGAAALRADGWQHWADVRSLPCEDGQRVRRLAAEQVLLPALAHRSGWTSCIASPASLPCAPRCRL